MRDLQPLYCYPMKPQSIKTLNPLSKVQIAKHIFLFVLSFLVLSVVNAQQNKQETATAIVTATIVTEMIGATLFENMSFANIKSNQTSHKELNSTSISKGTASFNIIGNSYAYAITLPARDILLTKKGSTDTMKVGSFNITSTKAALNSGEETLVIGAILNVNTFQTNGNYNSETPFTVTVNYN